MTEHEEKKPNFALHILVLYGCILIAWVLVDPMPSEAKNRPISQLLGEAMVPLFIGMFFAFILAIPHRRKNGEWPPWIVIAAAPLSAITFFFVYYGVSSYTQMIENQESINGYSVDAGYWYTDDNCEFSVQFPTTPSYRTNYGLEEIASREAYYVLPDGFHMRAECPNFGGIYRGLETSAKDENWVEMMRAFMLAEGLQNIQISIQEQGSTHYTLLVLDGRGYKEVSGINATYQLRLLVSEDSVMMLVAGGPSSRYPSRDVTIFLESYKYLGDELQSKETLAR